MSFRILTPVALLATLTFTAGPARAEQRGGGRFRDVVHVGLLECGDVRA